MENRDIRIEDLSGFGRDEIKKHFRTKLISFPEHVEHDVRKILRDVAERGDTALIEHTERFDGIRLSEQEIQVSENDIKEASEGIDEAVSRAFEIAIERVRKYHEQNAREDRVFVDDLGNIIGQRYTPVERAGIYIPGGKASYPSSLIMTAVPALTAGVKEVVVISPPSSFCKPSALCAALRKIGGISEVYRVGGAQGIAALAFGTGSIRKVDKIVGPGNIWISLAKKELYGYVGIDMVAGPSEVLVIADGSVSPRLTAVDLLAQAEHDEDAAAICVTSSMENAYKVRDWVRKLAEKSKRKSIVEKSILKNGRIYVVKDEDCAALIANIISPEHLEIQTDDPRSLLPKIKNAGAVFVGKYSAEAYGDYIAGPSHVLPTGGTARFFSPLGFLSFVKFSSVIEMSKRGIEELGPHASAIAAVEGLYSHADSIEFRKNEE